MTPQTVTRQAPLSEIFQAGILKWVAILSSRGRPSPGIKPESLATPALAGGFFTTSTTWKAPDSGRSPQTFILGGSAVETCCGLRCQQGRGRLSQDSKGTQLVPIPSHPTRGAVGACALPTPSSPPGAQSTYHMSVR